MKRTSILKRKKNLLSDLKQPEENCLKARWHPDKRVKVKMRLSALGVWTQFSASFISPTHPQQKFLSETSLGLASVARKGEDRILCSSLRKGWGFERCLELDVSPPAGRRYQAAEPAQGSAWSPSQVDQCSLMLHSQAVGHAL